MVYGNRYDVDMMVTVGIIRKIDEAMIKLDNREIDLACDAQQELTKKEVLGFAYKGQIFMRSNWTRSIVQAVKGNWPSLHKSLWPKINIMLRNREEQRIRLASIRQWMTIMYRSMESDQDRRDALPDLMASLGTDWAKLKRVRPLHEVLTGSVKETYEKLEEDIEYFSALPLMAE